MATKPELNIAVAYAKNKASEYNENFDRLLDYIEEVSEELNLKVNTINSQLSSSVLSNLQSVYPIGSLYIGVNDNCPIANLFGTWEKVAEGLCLQGATGSQVAGETVEAGLPNIKGGVKVGGIGSHPIALQNATGAFKLSGIGSFMTRSEHSSSQPSRFDLNASLSSSIYKDDCDTVQPPAYLVNVWKRTA